LAIGLLEGRRSSWCVRDAVGMIQGRGDVTFHLAMLRLKASCSVRLGPLDRPARVV
jgi:hypothetical protein